MAFAKKVLTWTSARITLAIAWLATLIRVTIPDYGYDYSLFENLGYDPTGWLHECFYISAFFVSLITLTYYWEEKKIKRVFVVKPRHP